MRTFHWLVIALASGALAAACSEGPTEEEDEGDGGSTGATTTSSSSTTTTTTTTTTTNTTTDQLGICGTELSYQDAAIDACVTASCCAEFDSCNGDTHCQGCMTGAVTDCDDDALYLSYLVCVNGECPTDMCDTGIGFSDQDTDSPIFDCNACGTEHCCAELEGCAGDGSDPAVNLCLACLNGDPSCTDSAIQAHADDFFDCLSTDCSTECF